MQLLSPEEEKKLYDEGNGLLEERDWVHDVLRVRRRMLEFRAKRAEEGATKRASSSRSGRRTKSVNYAE